MYFTAFTFSTNHSSSGLLTNSESESGILSNDNNSGTPFSLLSQMASDDFGFDAFGGKDIFGSFDISNLNESFFAFDSSETIGSVAFDSSETIGSVACLDAGAAVSCDAGASVSCGSSDGGGSFSSFC